MKLSRERIEEFEENGFLVLPELFSTEEVSVIRDAMVRVFDQEDPANIREKKSNLVRTATGLHLRDEIFSRLVRHPRLIEPAKQLRGEELYVQQCKINVKAAFEGEPWQWHQDFSTHNQEDGVTEPLALNLHIFLDDVNDFNGPLYFFKGSHKFGHLKNWHDTVSTSWDLWVIEEADIRRVAETCPLQSMTGKAGTVLIFGDLMLHGSPANISPWNRSIFSMIANPVTNAYKKEARPDHQHHRDLTPIEPLADDCLLAQVP
jgi:ectoine hydroxylase